MGLKTLKSRIKWLFTTPIVLRFRLRTLLLLVTIACVWLAWQALLARQQRATVDLIRRYGGSIAYDYHDRSTHSASWTAGLAKWAGEDFVCSVVGVGLKGDLVDDHAMAEVVPRLANLRRLRWLDIDNVPISNRGLAHLGRLRNLSRLLLRSQGYNSPRLGITDEGLGFIAKLKSLQSFVVNDAPITGRGLTGLENLTQLVSLNLAGTDIDDEGLRSIGHARHLQRLNLRGTKVTGVRLVHLQHLERLEELNLADTPLGDSGTAGLGQLKQLRSLDLSQTPIADASLDYISQLSELRVLRLYRTEVTDRGVLKLMSLVKLQELKLQGTRVSIDAGRELGRVLSACSIEGATGSLSYTWSLPEPGDRE